MQVRIDRRNAAPAVDPGAPCVLRWVVTLTGAGVLALAGFQLSAQLDAVATPCMLPNCNPPQLTTAAAESLSASGLTLQAWAWITLVPTAVVTLGAVALALLLAWRATRPAALTMPFVLLLFALGPASAFTPWPWLASVLTATVPLIFLLLLALFPDARLRPRWSAIPLGVAALWVAVATLSPIRGKVAANEPPWSALYGLVFAACLAAIVVGCIARYRRHTADARRSILLLAVVIGMLVTCGGAFSLYQAVRPEVAGIGTVTGSVAASASTFLVLLMFGVVAVATIRDGAYGVRVVVNRVILGGIGLLVAFVVYVVVAALFSQVLEGWLPEAIASAVAAVAVLLVFRPLIGWIDHLVYGDADDPDRLAARLSGALAEAKDIQLVVPDLLALVADRLRLPWLELDGAGAPGEGEAIELRPEVPGELVLRVGLRPGQRRLGRRDRVALGAAGPTLLSAVTAVRLSAELEQSRRRVLSAAEEERRALRRELHDELGPTLASARHRIAAARADLGSAGLGRAGLGTAEVVTSQVVTTDAAHTADAHLERAERSVVECVDLVRSLARRLRPPALDEHGLAGAIEAAADDLGLIAVIEARCVPLPDAVEVVLYRIAVEALANVARHAQTRSVAVRVVTGPDHVELLVRDDGPGLRAAPAGVGIISMRERAAELGGRIAVRDADGGGTLVTALLPIGAGAR